MNYAAIKKFDIANGPGVRVSLFVSGCRHCCEDCFNREAWDFSYGKPFDDKVKQEIMQAISPEHITGFSLLGGEPFEPENQSALAQFLAEIKAKYPQKDIWCYTGFVYEQLISGKVGNLEAVKKMLDNIDVLVDGRFVKDLKSPDLLFRGSSNQRIINVKESIKEGRVIWLEGTWQRKMGSANIYE